MKPPHRAFDWVHRNIPLNRLRSNALRRKFIRAERSPEKASLVPDQSRGQEPEAGNRQLLEFHGKSNAPEPRLTR